MTADFKHAVVHKTTEDWITKTALYATLCIKMCIKTRIWSFTITLFSSFKLNS